MNTLQPGLRREQTFTVTYAMTAAAVFAGVADEVRDMPAVWSTPDMISKMEVVAAAAVAPLLPEGQITVGSRNEVSHLGATPVGMTVRVTITLTQVEGRKLTFAVEAFDEKEKVGDGVHIRYVVDRAKFLSRLAEKS